jgi:hypothetical protein
MVISNHGIQQRTIYVAQCKEKYLGFEEEKIIFLLDSMKYSLLSTSNETIDYNTSKEC